MGDLWWGVLVVCVGCYALKLAGLSVPPVVLEHRLTVRATALIPVGLLAALVAVQAAAGDREVVVDARLAGVAVAVACLLARIAFLPMLVLAAAATALTRLVT
ncbi:AzlD domain-containing protein [Aeromicrobium alkaliterrae]|uniref:AzlD domain-containing protein n=1 Tax=Aeromicrobium alkaliterrae TaxID=302168 RepID=A0ABN2JLT3_9ACTN